MITSKEGFILRAKVKSWKRILPWQHILPQVSLDVDGGLLHQFPPISPSPPQNNY